MNPTVFIVLISFRRPTMLTPPVCNNFRKTSRSSQRSPNLGRLDRSAIAGNRSRRIECKAHLSKLRTTSSNIFTTSTCNWHLQMTSASRYMTLHRMACQSGQQTRAACLYTATKQKSGKPLMDIRSVVRYIRECTRHNISGKPIQHAIATN